MEASGDQELAPIGIGFAGPDLQHVRTKGSKKRWIG